MIFSLPRIGSRDVVPEIERKRAAVKLRKNARRCFGSTSCDCPRCR